MLIRILSIGAALAFFPLVLSFQGGDASSREYRFTRMSSPHVETVVDWIAGGLLGKSVDGIITLPAAHEEVLALFATEGRIARLSQPPQESRLAGLASPFQGSPESDELRRRATVARPHVERTLEAQVSEEVGSLGIRADILGMEGAFPPVLFRFESPPKVLIVSPRERIDRIGSVLLKPSIGDREADELENRLALAGFSAVVSQIGGLGVYPSMIPANSDVRWTARTVAHEWAHQYFALRPLGWRYAFGSETDGRMVTVNETAAELAGREIGDAVVDRYYSGVAPVETARSTASVSYRNEMRRIRLEVDAMLASGRVAEAEEFMEVSRLSLAEQGHYIRRLNQAYFAFHGSYADDPVFSGVQGEDIGGRIHALRRASASLSDFVRDISSVGDFEEFLARTPHP